MDWKYIVINEWGRDASKAAACFAAISDDELISAANKGTFKRAAKDLESGEVKLTLRGEFPEKGAAEVSFADGIVTAGKTIGEYSCSCPSKTVCRHIIGAAMVIRRFIEDNPAADVDGQERSTESLSENISEISDMVTDNKGNADEEENIPKKSSKIDEVYINEIKRTVVGILRKGIMNCGNIEQETLMSLSLKGGRGEYGRIASMCRTASADIEAMNSRSPAFEPLKASLLLGRIINTAEALIGEHGAELMENEGYTDRGDGYFIGLGAYPYRSKSGFAGITVLLYEKRLGEYFTYGCGLSDIYEKTADAASEESFKKQLKRHCHWANEVSLDMISGNSFRLINFKADGKNRISSSKQTDCIILCKVTSDSLPEEVRIIPPVQEYDYFMGGGRERFFVREISSLEDLRFDRAEQVLHFSAVSSERVCLHAELLHSSVNERAERFIEENEGRDLSGYAMVFRASRRAVIPVSIIGMGGVNNFFFK
ncbi:MAG: hypothetical protein K2K57_11125 [Oscillospiraceae bacterium]|nr:hypothetical protein [Oscillospiraceae bacterium]